MNLNIKEINKQNHTSRIQSLTSDHRGITLIALVITIIVMLILVAVTISMAVNGGLFGYAGDAARRTEEEKNKERNLVNIPANLSTDQLIERFTQGETETTYGIRSDGKFYVNPESSFAEMDDRIYTGTVYDSEHFSVDSSGIYSGDTYIDAVVRVWEGDSINYDEFTIEGEFIGPNWA